MSHYIILHYVCILFLEFTPFNLTTILMQFFIIFTYPIYFSWNIFNEFIYLFSLFLPYAHFNFYLN